MLCRYLLSLLLVAVVASAALAQAEEAEPAGEENEGRRFTFEFAFAEGSEEQLAEEARELAELTEDITQEMLEEIEGDGGDIIPALADGASTLANTQFYRDVEYFHGWHIQQNVALRHYRLLDKDDKRHTWGTLAHCQEYLEEIKEEQQLEPMSGTAVIVLHGLGGWRSRLKPLCEYLEEETDYTIFNVCYPSTRDDLGGHAEALAGIIEHLEGIEHIYFVAHSMGNIVVRRYLSDNTDPVTGQQGDPRIECMVMLAPPNQGAQFAGEFTDLTLYTLLLGDAAVSLAPEAWDETEKNLATPAFPFGILAGTIEPETGGNPLIVGEDDYLVGVEETKLPGASDFVILPLSHSEMNADPLVCEYTLRFLQEGCFISEADIFPLPAEVEPEAAGEEPQEIPVEQAPAPVLPTTELSPFADPFGDTAQQAASP